MITRNMVMIKMISRYQTNSELEHYNYLASNSAEELYALPADSKHGILS